MFKKLIVDNFQSHEHTELDFVPGVNIIVGQSTSGKTAILRAMEWVFDNRPLGIRFKSRFASDKDPVKVSLVTQDGEVISNTKIKSTGIYNVNAFEFKGMDKSVPDMVVNTLNLTDLNVQEQLDPHFLILDSPGEVAKQLNRVIRIEEVDGWITALTQRVNTANSEKTLLNGQIIELDNQLKQYKNLDQFEQDVERIEMIQLALDTGSKDRDLLLSLTEQGDEITRVLDIIESFLGSKDYVQEAQNIFTQLEDLVVQCTTLKQSTIEYESLLSKISSDKEFISCEDRIQAGTFLIQELLSGVRQKALLVDYIKLMQNVLVDKDFIDSLSPLVKRVETINGNLKGNVTYRESLYKVVQDISIQNDKLTRLKNAMNDKVVQLRNFTAEIRLCPLCGSELTEEKFLDLTG